MRVCKFKWPAIEIAIFSINLLFDRQSRIANDETNISHACRSAIMANGFLLAVQIVGKISFERLTVRERIDYATWDITIERLTARAEAALSKNPAWKRAEPAEGEWQGARVAAERANDTATIVRSLLPRRHVPIPASRYRSVDAAPSLHFRQSYQPIKDRSNSSDRNVCEQTLRAYVNFFFGGGGDLVSQLYEMKSKMEYLLPILNERYSIVSILFVSWNCTEHPQL